MNNVDTLFDFSLSFQSFSVFTKLARNSRLFFFSSCVVGGVAAFVVRSLVGLPVSPEQ